MRQAASATDRFNVWWMADVGLGTRLLQRGRATDEALGGVFCVGGAVPCLPL